MLAAVLTVVLTVVLVISPTYTCKALHLSKSMHTQHLAYAHPPRGTSPLFLYRVPSERESPVRSITTGQNQKGSHLHGGYGLYRKKYTGFAVQMDWIHK